jgi:prepilin-type N-terminal cleavage/methylation domain-containing protein
VRLNHRLRLPGGFTLVELTVALAVSSVALAALAVCAVDIQRGSWSAEDFSMQSASQQRILDYVARDSRNALGVAVENPGPVTGSKITLYLPDDYDAGGTPRTPLLVGGEVAYNSSTARNRISYYMKGNNLIREVNGYATVAAADVPSFQPLFTATTISGVVNSVAAAITFQPKFRRETGDKTARTATSCSIRVLPRNKATLIAPSPPPASPVPPPRRFTK